MSFGLHLTAATSRHELALALLFFTATLSIVYGPTVTHCFAMRDDYVLLWVQRFNRLEYFDAVSAMGRPLYQWLLEWGLGRFGEVCRLGALRAIALLCAVGFALLWYQRLRRRGWSVVEALAVTQWTLMIPAVGLFIGWITAFPFMAAMALGLLSGELALRGVVLGGRGRLWLIVAALLLAIALTLYQHAAMLYWLSLALALFSPRPLWLTVKQLVALGLLFGLTLTLYYLGYRWQLTFLLTQHEFVEAVAVRGHLVDDLSAKLHFSGQSLLLAATGGAIQPLPWLGGGLLAWGLLGLCRATVRGSLPLPTPWLWLAWWGLPLALFLPSLLIAESVVKLRLLCGLTPLVILYVSWSLYQWLPTRPRWRGALLGIAALTATLHMQQAIRWDMIALQQRERALLQQALAQPPTTAIGLLQPSPQQSLTHSPYLEFGTPTSVTYADFARLMVQLIASERHQTATPTPVLLCLPAEGANCAAQQQRPELVFIDLPRLLAAAPPPPLAYLRLPQPQTDTDGP